MPRNRARAQKRAWPFRIFRRQNELWQYTDLIVLALNSRFLKRNAVYIDLYTQQPWATVVYAVAHLSDLSVITTMVRMKTCSIVSLHHLKRDLATCCSQASLFSRALGGSLHLSGAGHLSRAASRSYAIAKTDIHELEFIL